MINTLFTAVWAFILGIISLVSALWFNSPEAIRALVTAIILFGAFLFFTRKTRRRIYDEIDAKDAARKANGITENR